MSKKLLPFLLILFAMAGLAGCISAESTPTAVAGLGSVKRITATPSPTEPATAEPTETATAIPTDTPDWTATPGPSPTPSNTPTRTPRPTSTKRPTSTPRPTVTPTPERQRVPALGFTGITISDGAPTPAVEVPTVVPTIAVPEKTTNILLLGNDDIEMGGGVQRTDSIIIVSVNSDRKTASMMSLPRDLYLYIPGWTMNKINTAVPVKGVGALKEAILYNFGIPIHYYARVNFDGFRDIVDTIGGIDIPVTCALEDWRLISPELDIHEEDNYERFRVEQGFHLMDGDTALWYSRSRKTTSDFDRGRRQQQVLRAILSQGVNAGMVRKLPELYGIFQDVVETDMDIGRMLQMATIAQDVQSNGIQSLYLAGTNVTPMYIYTPDGRTTAQLLNGEVAQDSILRLYQPPALSRANRQPLTVQILNGSGDPEKALMAAYLLDSYGFVPVLEDANPGSFELTTLEFNAPNLRGSFDWLITWIFDLRRPNHGGNGGYTGDGFYGIDLNPDSDSDYNYTLRLGEDFNPCRPEIFAPRPYSSNE